MPDSDSVSLEDNIPAEHDEAEGRDDGTTIAATPASSRASSTKPTIVAGKRTAARAGISAPAGKAEDTSFKSKKARLEEQFAAAHAEEEKTQQKAYDARMVESREKVVRVEAQTQVKMEKMRLNAELKKREMELQYELQFWLAARGMFPEMQMGGMPPLGALTQMALPGTFSVEQASDGYANGNFLDPQLMAQGPSHTPNADDSGENFL